MANRSNGAARTRPWESVKTIWRWRLIIAALAVLAVVDAALMPLGRAALAESQLGTAIPVGSLPEGIAVNPTTNRVYVANRGSDTVSVIDGEMNKIVGKPISVGSLPTGIAVNPVTNRVYVTLERDNAVVVIDGATGSVIGKPIAVGRAPEAVAVNPVTNRVYVANSLDNSVIAIDGTSGMFIGRPIVVG